MSVLEWGDETLHIFRGELVVGGSVMEGTADRAGARSIGLGHCEQPGGAFGERPNENLGTGGLSCPPGRSWRVANFPA